MQSHENERFACTGQTETPEPINEAIKMINYIGEVTCCAKNGLNWFAGADTQTGEI